MKSSFNIAQAVFERKIFENNPVNKHDLIPTTGSIRNHVNMYILKSGPFESLWSFAVVLT